ncbi:ATP-dependent nuclease [Mammaliicoccus sciuri]|uniref:ATP-dependent nuclease n=1 Tax=Mammaliicoccus sciuri TaxID=1296 RepID=UPI00194FD75F|nr:AAA family ATPase [Mammaliicoccus sciuri]
MIKIHKVEVANFRSFKEVKNTSDFKNFENINVITGVNNSGKTNVLRAINLFFHPEKLEPEKDMNIIKKLTGGASKYPKITVHFKDNNFKDENGENIENNYGIVCEFKENFKHEYKIKNKDKLSDEMQNKFENTTKIRNFLNSNFKCVYLSTTDEIIAKQTEKAVKDMILEYYKKKNQVVKDSIEKFEKTYSEMTDTIKKHISDLETSLKENFEPINNENLNISPKLQINENIKLTDFLIDNLAFKIDDSYAQDITSKGAGIQRSTLILLNIFLLSEIYNRKNKVILIDEPEAFLYPLLIENIKKNLEEQVLSSQNMSQLFITTHSRTFLNEVNNDVYKYFNIRQDVENKKFARSPNEEDIVKASVIESYNDYIKNKVLRNYGLLNELDDYEYIVICEGRTDKNYLLKLFEHEKFIPQIRVADEYNQKEFGKGASSIFNVLIFLDSISEIKRRVYILLDGDKAGREVKKKIEKKKYDNIKYKIKMLDTDKNIEDKVFTREQYVRRVLDNFSDEFKKQRTDFRTLINDDKSQKESVITITKRLVDLYKLNIDMNKLKYLLSIKLENETLQGQDIVSDIKKFFIHNKINN